MWASAEPIGQNGAEASPSELTLDKLTLIRTNIALIGVIAMLEAFEAFDEITAMSIEWACRAPMEDIRDHTD
jgi:hypothetical protein